MKTTLLLLLLLQPIQALLAMEHGQPPLERLHQQTHQLNQSPLIETQKKELERNKKMIEELEKKVGDLEAQEEYSENAFLLSSGVAVLSLAFGLYQVARRVLR